MIKKIIYYIYIILTCFTFTQCENGDKTINCFPYSTIKVVVNLDLPQFQSLSVVGGWVYIDQELAGTRGLIIVKTDYNTFKTYDRNAPHVCPGAETTLEVKDDIYIFCPEDGAKWILKTGQPLKVAGIPPRTYNTQYVGNAVYITN